MYKKINLDINILSKDFQEKIIKSIYKYVGQEKIIIGLSGGRSVNNFYKTFEEIFQILNEEQKTKIYFCFLDERVVPFDDEDSNYYGLKNIFLNKLIEKKYINKNQIILPDFNCKNLAEDYYSKIKKIDIGLFGVGEDGHIASLFPNHLLLLNENHNYLEILDSPKLPNHRITVSKNMILQINEPYLFFIGESKRDALNTFLNSDILYNKCPVKILDKSENLYIYSDLI